MNASKAKGTRGEGDVLRWLAGITGITLHRNVLHGSKDVGDIGGLVDSEGRPIVIEVKACKTPALREWLRGLDKERSNANARWAFIVWRTPGTTSPSDWIVITNDLGAAMPAPGPATMLAKFVRAACPFAYPAFRTYRFVGFRCDGQIAANSVDCDAVAMTGDAFEWWLGSVVGR